jgi:ribonuclease-3 family protein
MHDYIKGAELPSALSLAYLGDAVYSLHIRRMLIERGYEKSVTLNEYSLAYVTAEQQARVMRHIEPLLLDDEREVFHRAMNSKHLNRPKHTSIADYRYATGFEAVLGMLYWIDDKERMNELLAHIDDADEEKEV